MNQILGLIHKHQLSLDEMPFCKALKEGRFTRADILRAEIVELYRALNTRGQIQEVYKEKLRSGAAKQLVAANEAELMEEVIDDEGETDEHIDHLDMRFKLFIGTPVSRAARLKHNVELETINNEWMAICKESSLYALMAITAAIEDWYAPVSKFFEDEYRKRGFSQEELELFIVHQDADVDHSEAQFDILDRNSAKVDLGEIETMLKRTFRTSWGYDDMKLKFASANLKLTDFIE